MAKINDKDFKYYKEVIKEDKAVHYRQMMSSNLPDHVIAAYEGRLIEDREEDDTKNTVSNTNDLRNQEVIGDMTFNLIAIAVDTIIPSLYWQAPKSNIRSRAAGDPFSAEILNGLVDFYYDDRAKTETQRAIVDAFLSYGYGVVKCGYNARVGKKEAQKPSLLTGKTRGGKDDKSMEASEEFLRYERPFIERVSPRDCYLDSSKEFGKGEHITFRYRRSIQQLMDSNLYTLGSDFFAFMKVGSNDAREIKINIKEHWVMKDGKAWKMVYTEDWHEPLYWGESAYTFLPVSLLRFKDTPDRLYVTSHGNLGYRAQKEINYLKELQKQHVDKTRRQHMIDTSGLTEDGIKALAQNKIDGIVACNRPPGGLYQQIQTNPMSAEVFVAIQEQTNYLNQLLSTSGAVGGSTDAKLATQEKALAFGNQLRASGLQDKIRDFARDQTRKMVWSLVHFGDPQVTIAVTGRDVVDPQTGQPVTGKSLVLGGDDGLVLRDEIIGSIDNDYEYDVDMQSASRPDFAVVRKQLVEYAQLGIELAPAVQAEGKKINFSELYKDIGKTYEVINAEKYIVKMSEEELFQQQLNQQIEQQQKFLQNASESTEKAAMGQGVPEEAAIQRGAEGVRI